MATKKDKSMHIGSSLDDFLEEAGILEEVTERAHEDLAKIKLREQAAINREGDRLAVQLATLRCSTTQDGKFVYTECPDLAIATQGENFQDAMNMMVDAVQVLLDARSLKVSTFCGDGLEEDGLYELVMDQGICEQLREERKTQIEQWDDED